MPLGVAASFLANLFDDAVIPSHRHPASLQVKTSGYLSAQWIPRKLPLRQPYTVPSIHPGWFPSTLRELLSLDTLP